MPGYLGYHNPKGAEEMKVGFGIIGLGSVAKTHAYALERSENCRLEAVYSPHKDKAEAFSKEYGCAQYTDLEAFLSDKKVEVVLVATPSGLHEDVAVQALKAGKHVLIEKPIEINEEKARHIINEGKKVKRLVGGIFQNRFYDVAVLIKKAIDDGRFGRIVMVEASLKWLRSQAYYDSGAWRGTWDIDGGGVLMNQGIHAIDLLLWFGGDAESVSGFTSTLSHERIEVEDNGVAALRFKNGALGVISASTSIYPGYRRRIEVCGTEGSAVLEDEALVSWVFKDNRDEDDEIRRKYALPGNTSGGSSNASDINWVGHQRQFDDFARAVMEGGKPLVDGEEALRSVTLIRDIYRSAKDGKAVEV